MILFSHVNRSPWCAAGTDQCRKCGDDHDDGHTDSHTGKCQAAFPRDVADVNTVYNVIKHVDELGDHCWNG